MTERVPGFYEQDLAGVSTTRCVALMLDGGNFGMVPIGLLTWDRDKGTLEGVYVNAEYRGHGIAARLLELAGRLHGAPLTGTDEYTHAGFAWARKRGLKPKRGDRAWVSDSDMARMTSRLTHLLWGGGRSTTLVETLAEWQAADIETAGTTGTG